MAQQDRTTLKGLGTTVKDETTSGANTATRVGTVLENLADSNFNLTTDDISTISGETTAQLDARDTANRSRANHTGTQTVSTISDFKGSAFTVIDGANELTFDVPHEYTDAGNVLVGGDPSFTLAASGNVANTYKTIILDQPTTITLSADFEYEGQGTDPLTLLGTTYTAHVFTILMRYDEYQDKVFYVVPLPQASATDITLPTVTSATVEDADPDALVVVFSEAVTVADVTGLSLDGSWTGISVSSVTSGSGTATVTFALSGPIANGESGNFVYGGTNTIDDLAGNSLAAGSTAVTNNVAGVNQEAVFNGTTSQIDLGNPAAMALSTGNVDNAWSFAVDATFDSFASLQRIISKSGETSGTYSLNIQIGSSTTARVSLYDDTTTDRVQSDFTFSALSTATKYHIVVTYDGTEAGAGISFYINGVSASGTPADNGAYLGARAGSETFKLGRWLSAGAWFDGKMDNVAWWTRELSAGEVTTIYDSGSFSYDYSTLPGGAPYMWLKLDGNVTDEQGNVTATATDITYV